MIKKRQSAIRKADETLMRLMTINWRYRKLEDRPQMRIAVLVTMAALGITLMAMNSPNTTWRVLCILLWLSTFYEWRLWYKLKSEIFLGKSESDK
jgi:hypothetical protein